MKAVPIELKEANNFVNLLHRHHNAVYRDKFRIGCIDDSNKLIGVVQLGRPVSRCLDDGKTVNVKERKEKSNDKLRKNKIYEL